MQKHPMTKTGAEKLREELDRLKRIERPKIIQAIAEAREHGDLKENAEYHAARERQGFVEGRIKEVEAKISNAQIIDVCQFKNDGKVIFGATVTLASLENDAKMKYQIVGEDEADLKQNKISVTSPIARGLIGKYQGDEVEVKTPQGSSAFEIIEVEYI